MATRFVRQQFQLDAVQAVIDCLHGQRPAPPAGPWPLDAPYANDALTVDSDALLENIRRVQARSGLPESTSLVSSVATPIGPHLDVEMETGTGKTAVSIRTMLELNRTYGWSRFVVVVPSLAILEGHRRAFSQMEDHHFDEFGVRPNLTVYNSSSLQELDDFDAEPGVQVLLMTIQSFNAPVNTRRIHEHRDELGARRPLDVIAANRPVVIVDEPQRMGSANALRSLATLAPLLVIGFSATHVDEHHLVFRLDAVDAAEQALVKRIEVVSVDRGSRSPDDGVDVRLADLRQRQISEAIRCHLERERALLPLGIKALTLFFIDEVVGYRDRTRPDRAGRYARWFEDEYRRQQTSLLEQLVADDPHRALLAGTAAHEVHSGYFSIDRRSNDQVDGPIAKRGAQVGQSLDPDAYDLIIRDTPRLLSPDEPVRFIFSHSALREGWDLPNVMVICTLKGGGHAVSRRQEIGRGLRLAVDASGRRVERSSGYDAAVTAAVNRLTVITDESYAAYVAGLQGEYDALATAPSSALPRRRPPITECRPDARSASPPTIGPTAFITPTPEPFDTDSLVAGFGPALAVALHSVTSATDDAVEHADPRDLVGEIARAAQLTRQTVAALIGEAGNDLVELIRRDPDLAVEVVVATIRSLGVQADR